MKSKETICTILQEDDCFVMINNKPCLLVIKDLQYQYTEKQEFFKIDGVAIYINKEQHIQIEDFKYSNYEDGYKNNYEIGKLDNDEYFEFKDILFHKLIDYTLKKL